MTWQEHGKKLREDAWRKIISLAKQVSKKEIDVDYQPGSCSARNYRDGGVQRQWILLNENELLALADKKYMSKKMQSGPKMIVPKEDNSGKTETAWMFKDPNDPWRKFVDRQGDVEMKEQVLLHADMHCFPQQAQMLLDKRKQDIDPLDKKAFRAIPELGDWVKRFSDKADDPDGNDNGEGSAGEGSENGEFELPEEDGLDGGGIGCGPEM